MRDNPRSRARADSSISVSPNRKVGTGVQELPTQSLRAGVGGRLHPETPIANKGIPQATGPEVMFQVLAIAEGTQPSAPDGDGPDLSRICAQDNPNDRRHPNASFTCVTRKRKFCQLCKGVLELPALENEALGLSQECSENIHVFLY